MSLIRKLRAGVSRLFGAAPVQEKQVEKPSAVSRPQAPREESHSGKRRNRRARRPAKDSKDSKVVAPAVAPAWELTSYQVEPEEGKTRFHDLGLPVSVMQAIGELQYQYCTPIQAEILPSTLMGRDATGQAQTGTGKTAAFLITILNSLLKNPIEGKRKFGTPRALILAPTRELVLQIADDAHSIGKYTGCNIMTVFGGMDYQKQKTQLTTQVIDVVVATPGRLLDFQQKRDIDLGMVEIMVIDEADRMLDMGFIPDVRRIIRSTPPKSKRQTLLFSATVPPEVLELASRWTKESVSVEIAPEQVAVDTVDQVVYITTTDEKPLLLYNLLNLRRLEQVLVFSNRRHDTRKLADMLHRYNIKCAVLSGDVPQSKRLKTLSSFKSGELKVLVATDVAGRGIHVDGLNYVINYTLPIDPEDYVHRIGRTGRAGSKGTSISFACEEDAFQIPVIEDFIGNKLICIQPEEELLTPLPPPVKRPPRSSSDENGAADRSHGGRRGGRSGQGKKTGSAANNGERPRRRRPDNRKRPSQPRPQQNQQDNKS